MKQQYIEWMHGGLFFAESTTAKIDVRAVPAEIPTRAVGYRFFERQEAELDGEILSRAPRDHTPWTYFGTEYTLDQVKQLEGDYGTIIGNMEANRWTRVVHTVYGNWYPLQDDQHVDVARSAAILAKHMAAGHA